MTPGGGTTYFGVAALTFDAKGNLFITGDDETSSTATTSGAFSVLECPASCLYGATLTQPVVLWTEPAPDTLEISSTSAALPWMPRTMSSSPTPTSTLK